MQKFIEAYGWLGAIAILIAYALVSFGVLAIHSIWYQLLNIVGGLGIVIVSYKNRTYQPAILNIIWIIIALIAIVQGIITR